jgi:hypothetical protein
VRLLLKKAFEAEQLRLREVPLRGATWRRSDGAELPLLSLMQVPAFKSTSIRTVKFTVAAGPTRTRSSRARRNSDWVDHRLVDDNSAGTWENVVPDDSFLHDAEQ